MSIKKRGSTWQYIFDAPGSTKAARKQIKAGGFRTKGEAVEAEASRRLEEQRKHEAARNAKPGAPNTLGQLVNLFLADHAARKLAPKTTERYRELAVYLDRALMETPAERVTSLDLEREWTRLLECGGRKRGSGEARPLSAKTVRHIAGVVSSAFARGIRWGIVEANPATLSEPPIPARKIGMALTPQQQDLLFAAATSPWCLGMFLELSAATGARRGEVLALRWSDLAGSRVTIERSLGQTDAGLEIKPTKTEKPRMVALPASTLAALAAHRQRQDEFRAQFGADYAPGDLIFATPEGLPLRPDSVSAAVSALCKRLKLPKGASLHTLRHSHGSHLLAAGMDLAAVSERLGHSNVRVTAEVYSHALAGRDDMAAQKWEQFQQDARPVAEKPASAERPN